PIESATRTVAMVFAHTIVDAPKNGAMSLAAAISDPRVETPTVKTMARSRRGCGRSSSTARTLEYGRFAAAKATDGGAGARSSGAGGAAARDARLLPVAGADGARADRPHAVAVPRPRLPGP